MAPRVQRLALLALGGGLAFAPARLRVETPPQHSQVPIKQKLCGKAVPPEPSRAGVSVQAHPTLAGSLIAELSSRSIRSAAAAGVVSALVMAVLSAVIDPLKERFLRRRVYAGRKPGKLRCFFTVSLCVQLIKFPLFEPLLVWALVTNLLPFSSPLLRAALAGVAFATATLPFTTFRMGASNRSYAHRGGTLKALLPNAARDAVYAMARASIPAMIVAHFSTGAHRLTPFMPEVLFPSVFAACLLAAPLNELRDFSLVRRTASEFFLPFRYAIFAVIRSALQAEALVLGYRYAPVVVKRMTETLGHWKSTKAFMAHWQVLPELQLWALAGTASILLMVGCMLMTQFKRLSRSQPELLRDLLMD